MAQRTTNTFEGEIVVASRIVDYLSSGLYESPAACLKELVNNSYDADAQQVQIFVQPDADRIIIADDGDGMDKADFIRNFSRISETFKRAKSDLTEFRRPKIGKIGIGFIAANEICNVMEIESTKRGSTQLLKVQIDFAKMRQDLGHRRRDGGDFAKGDYHGEIQVTDKNSHYTHIFLRQVRGEAKNILVGAKSSSGYDGLGRSLYGLNSTEIVEALKDPRILSWTDFDPYSETMLRVALNVPVAYAKNWISPNLTPRVADLEREVEKLDFSVFYDGTQLRKPTVFRESGEVLLVPFQYKGTTVSAKGYFYVQHGTMRPQDLNGLLIRIRHAAVGGYDSTFLGYPTSKGTLFQRWISAEVWASDSLEEAMNIDRKTLRNTHPAYLELQRAVHHELDAVLIKARDILYKERSEQRRDAKATEKLEAIKTVVSRKARSLKPNTARQVVEQFKVALADPKTRKSLLRNFSVVDLYSIVLEVAEAELPPDILDRFVAALTRRLSRTGK